MSTQTVPQGNATNVGFKRTNNTQSLAGPNRAVIRAMDFLNAYFIGREKVIFIVQKQ